MSNKPRTFRDTLGRIEEIVREIEGGDVELETSVRRYEEGMDLIRQARTILAQAEQKVQMLHAGDADEPSLEAFDPEGGSGTSADSDE